MARKKRDPMATYLGRPWATKKPLTLHGRPVERKDRQRDHDRRRKARR